MLTYEELMEAFESGEAVIRCESYWERRAAVDLLCEMGFECNDSVLDHLNRSEASGDMTFSNPGLDSDGRITCYRHSYNGRNRIQFSAVQRIVNEPPIILDELDEDEFSRQINALLIGG